jgi:hypothetical protein
MEEARSADGVFVSYASEDAGIADSVCATLEQQGITCWIAPRDVSPGERYADAIVRAISASPCMVLVLSGHSIASPHVAREIERACAKRRPVIAFRIDSAALTPAYEYFLSDSQWLDARVSGVTPALTKLVTAVRRCEAIAPEPDATVRGKGIDPRPAFRSADAVDAPDSGRAALLMLLLMLGAAEQRRGRNEARQR